MHVFRPWSSAQEGWLRAVPVVDVVLFLTLGLAANGFPGLGAMDDDETDLERYILRNACTGLTEVFQVELGPHRS